MTEKWNRRTFIATCILGAPPAIAGTTYTLDYFSILSRKEPPPVRLSVDFEMAAGGSAKLNVIPPPVHLVANLRAVGTGSATLTRTPPRARHAYG